VNESRPGYGYRSLFWPIALIGIGVVWLLGNLGLIAPLNIFALLRLWPLLLIAIGLDLVFGRRSPAVGALIGLGTVVVAAAILVGAPSLGLSANTQVKNGRFTEPVGNATSARVELHLSSEEATVNALGDSNALIDANLNYVGEIDFNVQGDQQKTVRLEQRNNGFSGWPFGWATNNPMHWEIGLTPKIPIDLRLDASSGSARLNLADLNLSALTIDASSGSFNADLPDMPERYDVQVKASSGSMNLNVPEGADLRAEVDMSSGRVVFDVPNGAGVQVDVRDSSSGSVVVPSDFTRTRDDGRNRGTWESPNFAKAERQIILVVTEMSSGTFEVR
jgi:Domain of unknown function (DUF5668)/Putative adhesin